MVSIDLSETAGDPREEKWKLGQVSQNVDVGTNINVGMGSS